MISTQDALRSDRTDVWATLAAPLPAGVIAWRQDGRVVARDGRFIARFVAYIEANTVRQRLDAVVPGEWDLTLDLLPPVAAAADDGSDGAVCSFKARLQVLGVIREDVGTGRDYKQAATDAFKRAAVRFGIGHELYAYEVNWVEMDGDGKYGAPLEDPQAAYVRRHGTPAGDTVDTAPASRTRRVTRTSTATESPSGVAAVGATSASETESPACPVCGGRMWDNRLTKRNPKAPDFKCRDRSCDGAIWPARQRTTTPAPEAAHGESVTGTGDATAARERFPLAAEEIPF